MFAATIAHFRPRKTISDTIYTDQSRKRGTLESDLLMSTFAEVHLREMTPAQLTQYDLFLDENDWDIYYWATQEPSPTSQETVDGAGKEKISTQGTDTGKQSEAGLETSEWSQQAPRSGEWAQTIGTFKPAYRPVPARWKNSEILAMLRRHVISRSAGGLHQDNMETGGVKGTGGGMPPELFLNTT
jgi:succinate dehydrogenase flavin-adding protein (antitoxin of CptAB toxin-antitoxin module)